MTQAMKIAIVDDERDMRQSISQWLALSGYDTETFASAEEALKVLGPEYPGIVISDIKMPGMNGMQFLKKLMGKSISLTNEGWELLNKRWIYFFFGLALLNELVWRTQSEEFWVNFKVWGLLPITFIFTGFQIGLINKYKLNE